MNVQDYPSDTLLDRDLGQTRWSMVAAVREGSEDDARASLGALCRRYWVPIYIYVRRSGYSFDAASKLVPRFLSHLIVSLRHNKPKLSTGFRAFLQTQLDAFLKSAPDRTAEIEDITSLEPPWPIEEIEQRANERRSEHETPSQAMQRGFAIELIAIALSRLKREAEECDRKKLFDAVRPFLSREPAQGDYQELAKQLDASPLAVVIAVKRLRQRFQELIDNELAETVGDLDALLEERQALLTLAMPTKHHG